jgi:hypothetical protein
MATIQINNLRSKGFDLFDDSENYLKELTDTEFNLTSGGSSCLCVVTVVTLVGSVAYYIFKDPAPPQGAGNDPAIHGINKRNADLNPQ